MIRNLGAMFAGYIVMAGLTFGATIALASFVPAMAPPAEDMAPSIEFMILNLVYGGLFALIGGYVAATLAEPPRDQASTWLAMAVAALGIWYYFQVRGGVEPDWYLIGIVVVSAPAVLLGGRLRADRS